MPLTPTTVPGSSTANAQFNASQVETPKQQLTDKQEQVLKALDSALPFFDASDYGVKADKGEARTPPVHTGGAKGSNAVKDFFKSIGKAIASGFEKIGAFFKSLGKTETAPTPTRYGDTNIPLPDMRTADLKKAGGQLAYAFVSGGEALLSKMVGDLSTKLDAEMQRTDFKGTTPEFVAKNLNFMATLGYALEGDLGVEVRALIPQLRTNYADNPTALALLDAIETYDFATHMQDDFTKQIDELSGDDNPLGKFMRSNNVVSLGMFAMARADGYDMNKVANQILTPHMAEMADLQKSLNKLEDHDRNKEVLTGSNATRMMDLTKSILLEALKTEGPGSLVDSFGEDHIQRLSDMAQQIADRDDLPKDVRNEAIQTLYIDQIFLRTTIPALFNTAKSGTAEFSAVQLAQSIVNGAQGDKFTSEDMRNAYKAVAQEFRQHFVDAMIAIGMPVVP